MQFQSQKKTSWLKFLGKNLRLVGCATVCGKSEVMLKICTYIDVGVWGRAVSQLLRYCCLLEDSLLNLLLLSKIVLKPCSKMAEARFEPDSNRLELEHNQLSLFG